MNSGGCLIVVRDDGRCERRWWSLGGNRSAWWCTVISGEEDGMWASKKEQDGGVFGCRNRWYVTGEEGK
ncbi:hypothetical protein HanXRQr2_Chr14g0636311 [Helianthus annuus]|uniref:Uncharacterized protein n=1 Tax=Helianthus annuus TaxID=4232 RepID=A0A9K3E9D8_HELAN|nr:hypothetical protein HanXRQr2_Chr14g0636311 [Helianthus annuus]